MLRHLLLIGPDWPITARFRTELVRDALARGWRVTIAAGGPLDDAASDLQALGVTCLPLKSRRNSIAPINDLQMMATVARHCRVLRPDAALAFTVKPATFGLIGAALAGVPQRAAMITGVGYALMDGSEVKRRLVRAFVTTLYRISLRTASTVIFQNDDDLDDFRRMGLLEPATPVVRINGSGVDLDRFAYAPLPSGDFTFVMVARLLAEKGVREFVQAAWNLKQKGFKARFVLVGPLDTNPTAISESELASWVAEDIIEYHGSQADVRPFLRGAHVFVLPSYREGTPRSALEALATGRPVLTVDVPGCREVVRDKVTGRLVEARSIQAVEEAMRWFVQNRRQLPAMSIAARQDAERRFDVHIVNAMILTAVSGRDV